MTVIYFILAALALGILVFFHELGHYYMAKKLGMIVEVFSIGFGRPVLKWRVGDVDWQLGWLPFGGYVKIKGMEFGKKEQEQFKEPYEIPDGFFAKPPWKRICVAVAGPLANFILAFLLFTLIWAMGGREKPFSEYTQIIGWVDPQSEMYANGVRPGDMLTGYNGKEYTGSKDLLYAAMLGGKQVSLKGDYVDYATGEKTPFAYKIESYPNPASIEGIMTTGVMAGARYLIYDKLPDGTENTLKAGSPMEESGIRYGDRIVWADGEVLFSLDQLSYILNNDQALLTVKREETTFLTRQPRVLAGDLILPSYVQNELSDWQYEIDLKGRVHDLRILPFVVNSEGYIEAPLKFIDPESEREAFPSHSYAPELERPLEAGDRIIAIDGVAVSDGYRILQLLQEHKVQLMAQRNVSASTRIDWSEEDRQFAQDLDYAGVEKLASYAGVEGASQQMGDLVLLNPVEPKRIDQFELSETSKEQIVENYKKQKEEIEAIRDPKKRAQALQVLDESHQRLLLGIYLQDRTVDYNPGPFSLFGSIFSETYLTLKALVLGYLHPKWISGPLGIVQVIHHGWKTGLGEALFWISAISVNLGFLNLMPIPVLDGGYICLALWEMITRRRLKAKTMERLIIPFVVLLIGFLVFLTFQDISRLF